MIRAVTIIISCLMLAGDITAQESMTRKHEGLHGPVRTLQIERARITVENGTAIEGPHGLSQVHSFDLHGNKVRISYLQADGSTGTELAINS